MHNRKTSAYLPRNELHSALNRKISAYCTFVDYSIKDKAPYLNLKNLREPHFNAYGQILNFLVRISIEEDKKIFFHQTVLKHCPFPLM